MSFYSLDGSSVNNDLFSNKQIYETFSDLGDSNNNTPKKNYENFAKVPKVPKKTSEASDSEYQCSDNYSITGQTYGEILLNSSLKNCKTACNDSNSNCIGFNFDPSTKNCTLKNDATSLMNPDSSSTFCIKKAAATTKCKIKQKENAINELENIFKDAPQNLKNQIDTVKNQISLQEMVKNYYSIPVNEQPIFLNKLSSLTEVPAEKISINMPKLIEFVAHENTPNYGIIEFIKQISLIEQKENPNQKIISESSMPVPPESEINLLNLIKKRNTLSPYEQLQLINTISKYTGVSPEYIKKDFPTILDSINSGYIYDAGIYNKIKNLNNPTIDNIPYPSQIPKPKVYSNKTKMESESENKNKSPNMGNNPDGIYVDLKCFMNNIEILKNHSDNMMIDLSLLAANIKSCSYIKKREVKKEIPKNESEASHLINHLASEIKIPKPNVVKLHNVQANVLVSSPSENSNGYGTVLEIIKEPFESETTENNNWYDFIRIVILVIILVLLIFGNKKK